MKTIVWASAALLISAAGAQAACGTASLKGSWNYTSPKGAGGGGSAVCLLEISETGAVTGKRCFSGSRSRRDLGKPSGRLTLSPACDLSGEVSLTYGPKVTHFQMTGKMDASGRKIAGRGEIKGRDMTYTFTMTK